MTIIILKLILAHIIGDFFLQQEKWAKDKEKKKLLSKWLYIHVAIHIALMFLILWDLSYTTLIISIGVVHLIIDALKLTFQNKKTKKAYFFIDQLLHLISILILSYLLCNNNFDLTIILSPKLLLFTICLSVLTMPTSIIMKTILSKWDLSKLADHESLEDAGKYIGFLERILVLIFIILGRWEAVGFLITAKSVFRFGDLTSERQRILTEYVLIGTLLSFGIAIITGLIYIKVLPHV